MSMSAMYVEGFFVGYSDRCGFDPGPDVRELVHELAAEGFEIDEAVPGAISLVKSRLFRNKKITIVFDEYGNMKVYPN